MPHNTQLTGGKKALTFGPGGPGRPGGPGSPLPPTKAFSAFPFSPCLQGKTSHVSQCSLSIPIISLAKPSASRDRAQGKVHHPAFDSPEMSLLPSHQLSKDQDNTVPPGGWLLLEPCQQSQLPPSLWLRLLGSHCPGPYKAVCGPSSSPGPQFEHGSFLLPLKPSG